MEIANWKCPKCETLCSEDVCPVCGFNRTNLVDQTKEPEKKDLLFYATYRTAAEQENVQQPQTDFQKSTEQKNTQQPEKDAKKTVEPKPAKQPEKSPEKPTEPKPAKQPEKSPEKPTEPKPAKQPEKSPKKTTEPKTTEKPKATSHIPSSGELAPKVTKTAKPKKNKILGIVAVAVFLLCVIPANDYQSYASALIEKCSSDESNIQRFLEKGEKALNEGDYDKAKYFYEDKVLALDSQNADAMIGLLRISTARSDKDAITDRLNQLSKLYVLWLSTSRAYIANAVESLEASDYEQLKNQLQSQQATIDDVIQLMNQYENYRTMFGFDEIQTNMVDKYLECYDIANSNNYDITFKEQLLNDALARFPENEQLLSKQQDFLADKAEYETMVSFISQGRDLFNQSDDDGLCALIDSDSGYNGSTYYLVDGKYVDSVENGNGVIYDTNGIYIGDIVNNQRSGNGKQFLHHTGSERYSVAEGAWQNNQLNGEATCNRVMTDKLRFITSGNFTDGYENGTMTVKWHSTYDWSATYKAEMGDYVDATEESDGYHYAYASNNEMEAWLYVTARDGHGFWVH